MAKMNAEVGQVPLVSEGIEPHGLSKWYYLVRGILTIWHPLESVHKQVDEMLEEHISERGKKC